MTETLENHDTSTDPTDPVRYGRRDNRLYRALAWVGIAAGALFIVATVFFSGFILGQHSGGGFHQGPHRMMLKPFPGGPMGPDGPMGPRGPFGPGDGSRPDVPTPPSPPSTPPRS